MKRSFPVTNLIEESHKSNLNANAAEVMLDDVEFAIQDDFEIGKEQPLSDFNKVTKISSQMYDGVFEIDDEEEDSDAFIE